MPVPLIKSLAAKAGISMDRAEHLWKRAKKVAADNDRTSDWPYIVGIWKRMAQSEERELPNVGIAESMISMLISGMKPQAVFEAAQGAMKVRTFYDAGILHIATLDDMLIEPGVDSRVDTILYLTNDVDWPVDHPLCDFEQEGDLNDIYNKVIKLSNAESALYTANSRKRRSGARKAQRTKLRRP